jgi:CheY-like chemotaxis protein
MQPTRRRAVLVVDDDRDVRDTTSNWLEANGFLVVTATNGESALEILSGPRRPFVMIADARMPIMSGWELLNRVKSDPRIADVPVIMISGTDTGSDDRLAAKLMKPADPTQLLAKVTAALRRS